MSQRKVKWGILSTAKIGVEKVIPAMQKCENLEIVAIASRDESAARATADQLGIEKAYGSYEALLDDPEVEAIYNPLPNHLHFEWSKRAIEKGKHLLCEKPMVMEKEHINSLISLRDVNKVKVGEAFMVDSHPQWIEAARRIQKGELGKLRAIQGFFSYFKTDPDNIRNVLEFGGGGMWDIGCYPIHTARFVFGEEPNRVVSLIDRDPNLKIDRMGSVILDFPSGQCTFMVSTQLVAYQKMIFFGEKKKLEIEIPFNAPNDFKCQISVDDGGLFRDNKMDIPFDICDQYQLQGKAFSSAILSDSEVPVPLEDAYKNAAVLQAVFESEKTQGWVKIP